MYLKRFSDICPFLLGSVEGSICKASGKPVRDIEDNHPDLCIRRHFECCYCYLSTIKDAEDLSAFLGLENHTNV
jgi:hypothetical protein